MAADYNWKKVEEYAAEGELNRLAVVLENAEAYSTNFDSELASQWLLLGAEICFNHSISVAKQAAELGQPTALQHAWDLAIQSGKTLFQVPDQKLFEGLMHQAKMNAIPEGIKAANEYADEGKIFALEVLDRVEEMAKDTSVKLNSKEIQEIRGRTKKNAMAHPNKVCSIGCSSLQLLRD